MVRRFPGGPWPAEGRGSIRMAPGWVCRCAHPPGFRRAGGVPAGDIASEGTRRYRCRKTLCHEGVRTKHTRPPQRPRRVAPRLTPPGPGSDLCRFGRPRATLDLSTGPPNHPATSPPRYASHTQHPLALAPTNHPNQKEGRNTRTGRATAYGREKRQGRELSFCIRNGAWRMVPVGMRPLARPSEPVQQSMCIASR